MESGNQQKMIIWIVIVMLVAGSFVAKAQLGTGILNLKDKLLGGKDSSGAKGKDFTSISIRQKEIPNMALGQEIEIGIIANTAKGKELKTPGFLEPGTFKTVEWEQFTIQVEGGTFANGKVTVSSNPSDVKNHEVKIRASTIKNPEIKSELVLKLDYKAAQVADFSGAPGKTGQMGQSGVRGNNGSGSSNCSAGTNGGQGGNGGNGGTGQDIEAFVKMKFDDVLKKEMLQLLVKSKTTGKEQLYIVNPDGGKITVSADGGIGGSGGQGGYGGPGGSDTYKKVGANGGDGGNGGQGGIGGNGGMITAYIDPSAEKLVGTVVIFSNEGGAAGRAGQGGLGGANGDYGASRGRSGASGTQGLAGEKGPQIKIVKQKVN
jgi:hypothetical protein